MNIQKKILLERLRSAGYSEYILNAFSEINREEFVNEEDIDYAWSDIALPLGVNSTISQPYTIAFMLNLLELENESNLKVLEIGSGCGYVLALMNSILKDSQFFGLEINKEVGEMSIQKLKQYSNIKIFLQDGKKGLPEEAPFDRILISAACESNPYYLTEQLKDSGIIVSPVMNSIVKIKKLGKEASIQEFPGFSFVPLL